MPTTVFFSRRLSFSGKGINFRSAFWHGYPWIHSWIHPWYIYVAKTLKLINCRFMKYSGTDHIFERRFLWHCAAGFLRISGAMCSFTFNFASATIKCFPAFTRKCLPQFRVSILWKNYEGRSSLKTQLKIGFLLPYTGIVQKCLKISLTTTPHKLCHVLSSQNSQA